MATYDFETFIEPFGIPFDSGYQPLIWDEKTFQPPMRRSRGSSKIPEPQPLRITRFRKWHEISIRDGDALKYPIENWIHANLERKDYIIKRTKRLTHYKFREHSTALMCILAVS